MRLLFYTATIVFLAIAGIFAFYALQAPDDGGAAKVVLSIDASEPPAAAADRLEIEQTEAAPAEASQHAAYDDRGAGTEPVSDEPSADNAGDLRDSAGPDLFPNNGGAERPQSVANLDAGNSPDASQLDTVQAAAEGSSDAASTEESSPPALLPGTALSSVDPEGSPQHELRQGFAQTDAQNSGIESSSAPASLPRTTETPETKDPERLAALPETEQPGQADTPASVTANPADAATPAEQVEPAQVEPAATDAAGTGADAVASETAEQPGSVSQKERDLKKEFDAFLATLNEKQGGQGERLALVTPPPFPKRRPENIPPPVRTATAKGWAGTHLAATEATTRATVRSGAKSARIAILLRGVGRDDRNSGEAVTNLPSAVSLAVMPLSGRAPQWAIKAREAGHEVIIQLPFEPSDYPINNPGPETLLASSGPDENLQRLRTLLRKFDGYTGVTNYLGGRLLQSKAALRPILEDLKSKGLIYIGEGNNSHALLRGIAGELGLRYGGADVIIDARPTPAAIQQALDRLVSVARKDGNAIGMAYASRTTIEQLKTWSKSLSAKGVTLVPVGALAEAPSAS